MPIENFPDTTQFRINKPQWTAILCRFVQALRMNMVLVNPQGRVIISPRQGERAHFDFGFDLLMNPVFGVNFHRGAHDFLSKFEYDNRLWCYTNLFGFSIYALPVQFEGPHPSAYLILGPVLCDRRLDEDSLLQMAREWEMDYEHAREMVYNIPAMPQVVMNGVLDLALEILKDMAQIQQEQSKFRGPEFREAVVSSDITQLTQQLLQTIHVDEMLVTFLDVALRLCDVEAGSIMTLDEDKKTLVLKGSRGIEEEKIRDLRITVGQGVAGIAVRENRPFMIDGTEGDYRIQYLLKRGNIKHSIILPLAAKDQVFGVMNLHTEKDNSHLNEHIHDLQYLSQLISIGVS